MRSVVEASGSFANLVWLFLGAHAGLALAGALACGAFPIGHRSGNRDSRARLARLRAYGGGHGEADKQEADEEGQRGEFHGNPAYPTGDGNSR